jgi:hypothetical protein
MKIKELTQFVDELMKGKGLGEENGEFGIMQFEDSPPFAAYFPTTRDEGIAGFRSQAWGCHGSVRSGLEFAYSAFKQRAFPALVAPWRYG